MEIEKHGSEFESSCLSELKSRVQSEASENELLKKVIDDEVMLKFNLIGRKFDVDYALDTIKRYLEARYIKYTFVYDIPPSSVRHIIESGVGRILKNKDLNGNWVLVGNLSKRQLFLNLPQLFTKVINLY